MLEHQAAKAGLPFIQKNTGFKAKVTNLSSAANDIKITIEFAEIPASIATV